MSKIKIKLVNLPYFGEVDAITLMVQNFSVTATTCEVNYCFYKGNDYKFSAILKMNEEEFEAWGQDNSYVTDWALSKLNLEREVETEEL